MSFIDCVNRGDVDSLDRLMSDDHELCVFNENPLIGRSANGEAWRGVVPFVQRLTQGYSREQPQFLELVGCQHVRLVDDEHDSSSALVPPRPAASGPERYADQ